MKTNKQLLTAQFLLLAAFTPAAAMSDTTPPQLESIAISPTVVDTSSNSETILLTVRLTDDLSGFAAPAPGTPSWTSAQVVFAGPGGDVDRPALRAPFSPGMRVSGDELDGVYENVLTVPRFSRAGNWTLQEFDVADAAGNHRQIGLAELRSLGFPTQFTVQGTEDRNPPDIVSAFISPSTVGTTFSNQPITITVHLQDDLAGIGNPTGQFGYSVSQISFLSPSRKQHAATYFTAIQRAAGDSNDGIYSNTLWLPRFSETGTWSLDSLILMDTAGNERQISLAEALDRGLPAEFTVQGTGDTTPPQIRALDFSPRRIVTDESSQSIAVRVRLTDDLSGMSNSVPGYSSWGSAYAMVQSPSKGQSASVTFNTWNRAAGNNLDGVYSSTMTLPRFSETGVWTLTVLYLVDAAGNYTNLDLAGLRQLGFPTQFAVGIAPSLTLTRFPGSILLSWPAWATDFSLQSRDSFDPSTPWTSAGLVPVLLEEDAFVMAPVFTGQRFYRLVDQP
jgi:hypothetical protein